MFIIGGVQKTSLVDFPQKVAAVVFTQGCNFRCGYCHNPDLLEIKQICHPELVLGSFTKNDFLSFLKTRIGKLDGVVISGGEPTLQSGLYNFINEIKQMEFDVKLDTNGTNPKIVERLINANLLDYVAMDIKAPIEKYDLITCTKTNKNDVLKTIEILKRNSVNYEFRTTVIKSQLSFDDFEKIGHMIKGAKQYYLQKFVSSEILDRNLINETTYTDEEFKIICHKLEKYVEFVSVR